MCRADAGEPVFCEAELHCIVRVNLDKGIRPMACEFRREAGPGHRVPLIAYPPGVQKEWKFRFRCFGQNRLGDGYEARSARGREEASIREHSLCPARRTRGHWPLQRCELIVIGVAKRREAAKIEVARSIVLECRERGMFAEDRGGTRISERGAKAHPLGNFRHGPPIGLRLSRGWSEGALAGDSPLGIDRKSTRLNSSHITISYAVFCLK